MSKKISVYVAGPCHSSGTQANNVRRAIEHAERIRAAGYLPFVPHLFMLWKMQKEGTDQSWIMDMCFEWVRKCDAFYRLDGVSHGSDREEALARELGKPIYYEAKLNEMLYNLK